MNTVTLVLIFGIISCAYGNDFCQELNASKIHVTLTLNEDALTLPVKSYLNNISLTRYEAAHFKDLDMPVLCPEVMKNLRWTKMLILDNVNFRRIDKDAFTLMESMKYFAIVGNKIGKYDAKIDNMLGLKMLLLEENRINDIEPEQFTNLPDLQVLQLSQNNISVIRHWFSNCKSLSEIRLDNNNISKIPSDAFINLKSSLQVNITINDNNLETIESGALNHLQQIGRLELSNNKLKQLPGDFLKNLHEGYLLDLSFNSLECIPEHLFSKFKYIELIGNPLSTACIPKKEDARKLYNVTLVY